MSLFGDIATALGHTVDSLAQEVGEAAGTLESLVSEFDSNGIDVITAAAKLNLPVAGFLRSILDLMGGDPHQRLLQHLVGPVQPASEPINKLSSQWMQMSQLHQNTAQQINTHMNDLFVGSTTDTYKSPAADALLSTHQDYQSYFTTLVDHAQTQQGRHATLGGHVDDYLSQAPGKVYSLSAPMAALGVLSLNTATVAAPPPPWIDPNFIQGTEDNAQNFQVDAESFPDPPMDPISYFFMLLELLLYLFVGICLLINAIQSVIQFFQGQQKSTPPAKKSLKPGQPGQGPLNNLTPAQERLHNDVKSRLGYATYDDAEIDALIRAGYLDPDAIAAIMRGGNIGPFKNPNVVNMINTLTGTKQLDTISLLRNGIDASTVIRLNKDGANIHDIATNVQFLTNAKIKVKLMNVWLNNGTNLNDAIALHNQGVDLNLIGTSPHVGDFTNTAGASVNEIISRLPEDARIEHWTPIPGHAQQGMKFSWKDAAGTWRVRMHDPDPSAGAGTNAASKWILRVQRGSYFMDSGGIFYKDNILKETYKDGVTPNPNYNAKAANDTHIPIQTPPPSPTSGP